MVMPPYMKQRALRKKKEETSVSRCIIASLFKFLVVSVVDSRDGGEGCRTEKEAEEATNA
jgi:hypothetical protein